VRTGYFEHIIALPLTFHTGNPFRPPPDEGYAERTPMRVVGGVLDFSAEHFAAFMSLVVLLTWRLHKWRLAHEFIL